MARWLNIVVVAALTTCACGSAEPEHDGDAIIDVEVGLDGASVDRVTATVEGEGVASRTIDLVARPDGTWSGVAGALPADTVLVVAAEALSQSGAVLTRGATTASVDWGSTATVGLMLQQAPACAPHRNAAPIIWSICASSTSVAPGEKVTVSVVATDPDKDRVTITWTAKGGTFASPSAAKTTWTAPAVEGTYVLTATARDGRGGVTSACLTIKVTKPRARVEVHAILNAAPIVDRIDVAPLPPYAAPIRTQLTAVARDPDGWASALEYTWSVPPSTPCPGTFDAPRWRRTTFTPAVIPAGGSCTAVVTVRDARGAQSTGTVRFQVVEPSVTLGPRFVGGGQSAAAATPAGEIVFDARFVSDDGTPTAVTWSTSPADLGMASGTPSTARFPAACARDAAGATVATLYTVVATAHDATGFTPSHAFEAVFCPAGAPPSAYAASPLGALLEESGSFTPSRPATPPTAALQRQQSRRSP
jgi:hypothetical protein